MSNEYVAHAVGGIKVIVCALMLNTVVTMGKKTIKSKVAGIVCLIAFALAMFTPVPSVIIVICAGLFGITLLKLGRFKE